jgi:hypothetical protein
MIKDFIYYWRNYGFQWAWLYLQVGANAIDGSLALIDNDCHWDKDCDCLELI